VLPDAWAVKLAHWAVRIVAWDIIKITSEIGFLLLFKAKKSQKSRFLRHFVPHLRFNIAGAVSFVMTYIVV